MIRKARQLESGESKATDGPDPYAGMSFADVLKAKRATIAKEKESAELRIKFRFVVTLRCEAGDPYVS